MNVVSCLMEASESVLQQNGVRTRAINFIRLQGSLRVFSILVRVVRDGSKNVLDLAQIAPRVVHHRVEILEAV